MGNVPKFADPPPSNWEIFEFGKFSILFNPPHFWENLDEIHQSAVVLKTLNKNKPFAGVNLPLHPGAVKYYREIGTKIPADILP